jgi:hypothetical protein
MTLSPNVFPCIEDYLSKFKTLRILCKDCQIDVKDDRCIYVILANLGSAYSVFVSTFYATEEALGSSYQTIINIFIFSRGRVYCNNNMLYTGSLDETNSDIYTG